jgi:hypothetical protein
MTCISTSAVRPGADGNRKTVRVLLDGTSAFLEPGMPDILQPVLRAQHDAFVEGGPRGFTHTRKRELYFVAGQDRSQILVGFVPLITSILRQRGHEVVIEDLRPPRSGMIVDEAAIGRLVKDEAAFVQTLVQNRRGQVIAPRLHDRVALVAAAATALPAARITVVAASRSGAQSFFDRLGLRLREKLVLFNSGGVVRCDARLKVTTWASLDEGTTDLLVFADATDVLSQRFLEAFAQLTNQHVFGFLARDDRLGARERMRLEGLLGPVVHEVFGPDGVPARVHVLVAEVPWAPVSSAAGGLERKRRAVWHNDHRNAAIAGVASALAAGRPESLCEYGLALDNAGHVALSPDPGIVVLVESPEHGRELARLLPGWVLLEGTGRGQEVHQAAPGGPQDVPGDELPRRAIATQVYAHGLDSINADVLIRADGSHGPLGLRGYPPRSRAGVRYEIVLVDFGDDGDEVAVEATRRRLDDYESRGWEIEAAGRWHHHNPEDRGFEKIASTRIARSRRT